MVKELILSDYQRCGISKISVGILFSVFYVKPNPGLKFMTIFRLVQHYRRKNRLLFYFFFLWYRRLRVKYGFDISYRTQIGKGFYIGHFGGIVIHGDSVIGDNCNISQGITIGVSNYGKKAGVPTIGNEVFMGPNAGVFGNITIGNGVTIGANTVVTENIPDHQTVLPAATVIIAKDLSPYYIQNKAN
ncbi:MULTISPECIES: serine O-acetyltransferase [Flavobacterium]|uniref:Serine acetyltransferase n=1 Tax=Flavobacterium sedimenticola TaxID=3043286 RepID=A0ABT6XRE9_9FLAO|nr:serine acetyltransferase [Flavobacterium sedimenticola]MDI9257666.1 serine acetyltransferase [Flavobacterium sedimenticola]